MSATKDYEWAKGRLECATLVAPMDYAKPDGKKIELVISRLPASAKPMGDIIIITGGPGEHGLGFLEESFDALGFGAPILAHFNIIGYAPRGIAPSTPIECDSTLIDDPKAWVKSCQNGTGALLNHIDSHTAAQDVEQIRQALGSHQINAIAYSYGTKVLALYADKYPKHLRTAVFDGVVDISEDYFTALAHQERGFEDSFTRFLAFCAENDCPLDVHSKTPIKDFADTLDIDGVDAESLATFVQQKLFWSSHWEALLMALNELKLGSGKQFFEWRDGDDKDPTTTGLIAINCADGAPKLSRDEYIKRMRAVQDESRYDNVLALDDDGFLDACFYWPYKGKDTYAPIKNKGVNALFVAQSHDPTTPHANAKVMAKMLGAPLLTQDGDGHTLVFAGTSACVDKKVTDFILTQKPPKDLVCMADE